MIHFYNSFPLILQKIYYQKKKKNCMPFTVQCRKHIIYAKIKSFGTWREEEKFQSLRYLKYPPSSSPSQCHLSLLTTRCYIQLPCLGRRETKESRRPFNSETSGSLGYFCFKKKKQKTEST